MNLDRFASLVGDRINEIVDLKVLIVGIGGVGGYVLEGLVRSGVKDITIIDNDKIDSSNLNRQIITNTSNIGCYKVDEAVKRSLSINPDINIKGIIDRLDSQNVTEYVRGFDYVIDACDDVKAKISLIKHAYSNKIKIFSCMGTAKKIDALKLKVDFLNNTSYCPLARKVRRELSIDEQKYVKVIYSTEESVNINMLGSTSYVPGIAGLMIAGEVIKDVIKQK